MSCAKLVVPFAVAVGLAGSPSAAFAEDAVGALARSDRGAPGECRLGMHDGVTAVACAAKAGLRLWAPGSSHARRVGTRTLVLVGEPLVAGARLVVRSAAPPGPAQLVVIAEGDGAFVYARFRLRTPSPLRALLTVPRAGGDPRLRIAGRPRAPAAIRRAAVPPEHLPFTLPRVVRPPVPVPTPPSTPPAEPVVVRECGGEAPADAADATSFDRLWHDERNGLGWTGGDGAVSVALGDGRVAWLFGDTFLGGVRADGTRDPIGSRLVRNALVVQDGTCLTTYAGGTTAAPAPFLAPADPAAWWWPASAQLTDAGLEVVLQRVVRTGPTDWDFRLTGQDLAVLDPSTFAVRSVQELPGDASMHWGVALLAQGGATYVYGIDEAPLGARLFLARTTGPSLADPWRFYRGGVDPWSDDAADTVALTGAEGLSASVGVVPAGDDYALVSQAPVFGTAVLARPATAPEGPFGDPVVIASAPTPDVTGSYTYGARLHPELATADMQLLSYNVNGGDVYADASLYRPRFEAIAWPPAWP